MGDGPIPWNIIEEYADRWEMDFQQRHLLHYHVRGLEQKENQIAAAKRPKQGVGNGNTETVRPQNAGLGQHGGG